MWKYTKALFLRIVSRPAFDFLVGLTLTVILVFSGIFYLIERDTNIHMNSFFDAVYFTVSIVTTVGLGDISPHSTAGKVAATLLMLIGASVFVSFTALISTSILEVDLERHRK